MRLLYQGLLRRGWLQQVRQHTHGAQLHGAMFTNKPPPRELGVVGRWGRGVRAKDFLEITLARERQRNIWP